MSPQETMKRWLETGVFSDCTVVTKTKTWKTHPLVLCTASPFFKAALTAGFQETVNRCVDLSEEDPVHVEFLLKMIYGADVLGLIDDPCKSSAEKCILAAKMQNLTDQYQIRALHSGIRAIFEIEIGFASFSQTQIIELLSEVFERSEVGRRAFGKTICDAVTENPRDSWYAKLSAEGKREIFAQVPSFGVEFASFMIEESKKPCVPGCSCHQKNSYLKGAIESLEDGITALKLGKDISDSRV